MAETILELAEAGKTDEAVQKILELGNLRSQIEFLRQLAYDYSKAQGGGNLTKDGRELVGMLDEAYRRRDNPRVQLLFMDRAKDFVAKTYSGDHAHEKLLNAALQAVVDDAAKKPRPKVYSRVEEIKPEESTHVPSEVFKMIQLTGVDTLTPQTLKRQITPYLESLAELQEILSEIKKTPCLDAHVYSIKEESLIRVDINGISDAVQTVLKVLVPYRRQNAKTLARYAVIRERLELAKVKASGLVEELQQETMRARLDNGISASAEIETERHRLEVQLINTEIERQELEYKRMEIENRQLEIDLGLELAQQIAPELSEADRVQILPRLATVALKLASSRLEIQG